MSILQQVRDVLRSHHRTRFMRIEVEEIDSTICLRGATRTYYQKQLAQEVVLNFVRHTPFCVDNQIEVVEIGEIKNPKPRTDEVFTVAQL
jgi:hypothetical protein